MSPARKGARSASGRGAAKPGKASRSTSGRNAAKPGKAPRSASGRGAAKPGKASRSGAARGAAKPGKTQRPGARGASASRKGTPGAPSVSASRNGAPSASRRARSDASAAEMPAGASRPNRRGTSARSRRSEVDERGVGGEQVEGLHAVRELLLVGRRAVRELLVSSERRDRGDLDALTELAADLGVTVTPTSSAKLERIARTEAHQGVVALAEPLPEADLDDLLRARTPAPFLLLLDGVTDPGNLGAVLRSAECAGVTGVVLPRHRAVHVTPAATKTAAGAVEHLPIALVGGLPAAIASLRDSGVWVVGLDAGGSTTVDALPAFDGPVALVLGSEGRGLSRLVRERVDVVASIPLHGQLESLNVAAAGAIACYEIARRRGESA